MAKLPGRCRAGQTEAARKYSEALSFCPVMKSAMSQPTCQGEATVEHCLLDFLIATCMLSLICCPSCFGAEDELPQTASNFWMEMGSDWGALIASSSNLMQLSSQARSWLFSAGTCGVPGHSRRSPFLAQEPLQMIPRN